MACIIASMPPSGWSMFDEIFTFFTESTKASMFSERGRSLWKLYAGPQVLFEQGFSTLQGIQIKLK